MIDDLGAIDTFKDQYEVRYEIRSSDKQLYRHLNRCFRKTAGISVTCKNISDDLSADALVSNFMFAEGKISNIFTEICVVNFFNYQKIFL